MAVPDKRSLPAELIRLMRPNQWIKNLFVVTPLFFTPAAVSLPNAILVLVGAVIFCIASSSIYVFNDTADRDADRIHPIKRYRPVASGAVSRRTALVFFFILAALSLI